MTVRAIVRKLQSTAFILDSSKLTRLVSIIEQKFKEIEPAALPSYRLEFKRGKSVKALSLDEVLAQDNSISNPIISFEIHVGSEDNKKSGPECTVHFDNDREDNVGVWVASDDHRWANTMYAEIEEQVERTIDHSWVHKALRRGIFPLTATFIFLFSLLFIMFYLLFGLNQMGKPTGKVGEGTPISSLTYSALFSLSFTHLF